MTLIASHYELDSNTPEGQICAKKPTPSTAIFSRWSRKSSLKRKYAELLNPGDTLRELFLKKLVENFDKRRIHTQQRQVLAYCLAPPDYTSETQIF